MNAFELLQTWPGWEKVGASAIFDSPAWSMPVRWGDSNCKLRRSNVKFRDVLGITIHLDDEENFLGICNREAFPDLHVLWDVKNTLPDSLKLALAERECGPLFQILENASRRQLNVIGIAPTENREGTTGFEIIEASGNIKVSFMLKVTPDLIRAFGHLKYIDLTHESIRAMTRPARAVYASFNLTPGQVAGLAPGDYLMLPEIGTKEPTWETGKPADDTLQVCSPQTSQISFGEYADDSLPSIDTPTELTLLQNGKTIANGRLAQLAGNAAFAIEEVL